MKHWSLILMLIENARKRISFLKGHLSLIIYKNMQENEERMRHQSILNIILILILPIRAY